MTRRSPRDRRRRAVGQLTIVATVGSMGALASAIVLPMTDASTSQVEQRLAATTAERRLLATKLLPVAVGGDRPQGGASAAPATSVDEAYRTPTGASVAWFGADGAVARLDTRVPVRAAGGGSGSATGSGGATGRLDTTPPAGAAALRSAGSLVPERSGRVRFDVAPDATCSVGGRPVRSGAERAVRAGDALPYRCAAPATADAPLRWSEVEGTPGLRPTPGDHAAGGDGLPLDGAGLPLDGDDEQGRAPRKDSDGDGIPDAWEHDGYTVSQQKDGSISVLAWDEAVHPGGADPWGNPFVRYTTSPAKASTNDDPWTDYQKATTELLLPGISPEARHPLVAAVPDVEIDMTRFRVIRIENWSSDTGGMNTRGVTRVATSRTSREYTVGGQGECGTKKGGPSCSFGVNFSATGTSESVHRESAQNSAADTWRDEMSLSTAKAARILPSVRYRNVGTAPLVNAQPKFTMTVGETPIASLRATPATSLDHALPGEAYPSADGPALAFERVDNFLGVEDITIDLDTYRALQESEPGDVDVLVSTTDFDAPVVFIDQDDGLPFESVVRWKDVRAVVAGTNATIVVERADGTTTRRQIAAPTDSNLGRTVPQLTLGESLALTHGAEHRDGRWFLGDAEITEDSFKLTMSAESAERIADQAFDTVFDIQLQGGMAVALKELEPGTR